MSNRNRGILQLNSNHEIVNSFSCVKDAAKTLGISASLIYGVLQGRQRMTHNFYFVFQDEYYKDVPEEDDLLSSVLIAFNNGIRVKIPTNLIEYTITPDGVDIEV